MDGDARELELTGFAWPAWPRRVGDGGGAAAAGLLIVCDSDIVDDRISRASGRLLVLARDRSNWKATTLSRFSPGANKAFTLLRTGARDWTPAPLVFEKLAGAFARGVDVLALPVQRATVVVRVHGCRRAPTGTVETVEFHAARTDWAAAAAFLSALPLDAAPPSPPAQNS